MLQEPTFSIIIPHYNIPDLLMRCLNSIPVREDVQVIVVDDNSPEADTYQERYPSLSRPYLDFFRTTKGGGAGYARNIGMERAKGKWLIFADADDLFVDNFDTVLNLFPIDETADIVFFKNKNVLSDDILTPSSHADYLNDLITHYLETGDDTGVRCQHYVPWGKIIKHSFIRVNSIVFDEIPFANDVCFSIAAGCKAQSIRIQDTYLYLYTLRTGSLCTEFAQKPGELETRSEAMFRAQKIIYESGHHISGRNPLSNFLSSLYQRNRDYYDYLFRRLPETGLSQWSILRQVAAWYKYSTKLLIYFHSIPLIILSHFTRTH